jgi:hypothetical protein
MRNLLSKNAAKAGSGAEKKELQKELAEVDAALKIFTAYNKEGYRSENTSESYNKVEQKHTTSKETDTVEQAGNLLRLASMFLHSVQNVHEQSSTLSKAFEEAKEEAYQKTYRQSDIALSSQDFTQQYASDIKLEALERFQSALSSGDKRAIVSSLVELGTDPNSRVSMTVDQFGGGQKDIKEKQDDLITRVEKNTEKTDRKVPAPGEIENNPEAKKELKKAKKLKKPNVKVHAKPPEFGSPSKQFQERWRKEDKSVEKPSSNSGNPGGGGNNKNPPYSHRN